MLCYDGKKEEEGKVICKILFVFIMGVDDIVNSDVYLKMMSANPDILRSYSYFSGRCVNPCKWPDDGIQSKVKLLSSSSYFESWLINVIVDLLWCISYHRKTTLRIKKRECFWHCHNKLLTTHRKPRVGQFLKVESTESKISSTLRILSFQLYFPELGFLWQP